MQINKRLWAAQNGQHACLFTLDSGTGLRAVVSNYGGILQSLFVCDASGTPTDVVLGYDTLEEYQASDAYLGALIGPVAGRVRGATLQLADKRYPLAANDAGNCLHSGPNGFHAALWDWRQVRNGLELSQCFSQAVCGFPGTLQVRVRYLLPRARTLRLEYEAVCDTDTVLCPTHHSYFDLSGGTDGCKSHRLTLCAAQYAQSETARLLDTAGTPMDLRQPRYIGDVLRCTDFSELAENGGIDHYFSVSGTGLRPHALLESEQNGLSMLCRSDAPGLVVYTANQLSPQTGKHGRRYQKHGGICLETGRFPDAVNHPSIRQQVLLQAGQRYKSCTEFEFLTKKTV